MDGLGTERFDLSREAEEQTQRWREAPTQPRPDFLFAGQSKVLSALRLGRIRPGAIMALLGAPGLGKSTIVERLLAGVVEPARVLPAAEDARRALRDLNAMAIAAARMTGRRCSSLLVVEEAHELSTAALRRLLVAQQGYQPDPPGLVLVGRPALQSTLGQPGIQPFRERILELELTPLSDVEVENYIEHLFQLAGGSCRSVLRREALNALIRRAEGNPRTLHRELNCALRRRGPERPPGDPDAQAGASVAAPAWAYPFRPAGRHAVIASTVLAFGLIGSFALWPEAAVSTMGPLLGRNTARALPQLAAAQIPFPAPATLPAPLGEPSKSELVTAEAAAPEPVKPVAPVPATTRPALEPAVLPPDAALLPVPVEGDMRPQQVASAPEIVPVAAVARLPIPAAAELARAQAAADGSGPQAPDEAPPPPPQAAETAFPFLALPALSPPGETTRPAAASPPPSPSAGIPAGLVPILLRRGEEMLRLNDVSAARRLLETAARAGSARAALLLGDTYAPGRRAQDAWAIGSNIRTARQWYQRAAGLGDDEAGRRLSELAETGP